MARKTKPSKQKKSITFNSSPVDKYLDLIGHHILQENLFQQGLTLMEAERWQEAGQAFQASIAMGDCLAQPWGNLGICLMMQERYDEAEAALKRALEIDPQYTLAKNNLAALPAFRRTGPPAMVALNEPFKHSKLKQFITFVKE